MWLIDFLHPQSSSPSPVLRQTIYTESDNKGKLTAVCNLTSQCLNNCFALLNQTYIPNTICAVYANEEDQNLRGKS